MAIYSYEEILIQRAGVVELRAFNVGGENNLLGRFDNANDLAREAKRLSGNCEGVYTTLNRIDGKLIVDGTYDVANAAAQNKAGVRDEDITHRVWLPMDFDSSIRPKDKPASTAELEQCEEVASGIATWLAEKGWPQPVAGCSGNGYHLLFPINLESTELVRDTIRRMFVYIALKVLTDWPSRQVKFDTVCFNASRIWKLYGTMAMKGDPTTARPHRPASCTIPEVLTDVSWDQITSVAGTPESEKIWMRMYKDKLNPGRKINYNESFEKDFADLGKGSFQTMDVVSWFEAHEMYRFPMREEGKHSVFCPWADNHSSVQGPKGTDTIIWEPAPEVDPETNEPERQWPVFHCSHESCGDTPSNPDGVKRDFAQLVRLWGDSEEYCEGTFLEEGDPGGGHADIHAAVSAGMDEQGAPAKVDLPANMPSKEPSGTPLSEEGPLVGAGVKPTSLDPRPPEDPPPPEPPAQSLPKEGKLLAPEGSTFTEQPDNLEGGFSKVAVNPFAGGFLAETPSKAEEPAEAPKKAKKKAASSKKASKKKKKSDDDDDDDEDDFGLSEDILFNTADEYDRAYMLKNLVTISGSLRTYHIGWDRTLGSSQLVNTFRTMVNRWAKLKKRQTVLEENFVFDPSRPPLRDPANPHVLNRFRGMPAVPKIGTPEQVQLLRDHLIYLSEDDEKQGNWTIGWLAYGIQNPGYKLRSAIIFKGVEGTGKNLFFDAFVKCAYGKYGVTIGAETLCGKYNTWAHDKLFVLGNEVSTSKDRRDIPNKLKDYITGLTFNMEAKFLDVVCEAPNRMNFIFLSNEDVPVTMGSTDRRYCIYDIRKAKGFAYYAALVECLNSGGMEAFYHYLATVDIPSLGFDPDAIPPWNDTKQAAIDERMPPQDLFLQEVRDAKITATETPETVDGVDMPFENLYHRGAIDRQDLWLAFNYWCKEQNKNFYSISNRRFYNAAQKMFGEPTRRNVAVKEDGSVAPPGPASATARRRIKYFFLDEEGISTAEIVASTVLFRRCLDANRFRDSAPPVSEHTLPVQVGELALSEGDDDE